MTETSSIKLLSDLLVDAPSDVYTYDELTCKRALHEASALTTENMPKEEAQRFISAAFSVNYQLHRKVDPVSYGLGYTTAIAELLSFKCNID